MFDKWLNFEKWLKKFGELWWSLNIKSSRSHIRNLFEHFFKGFTGMFIAGWGSFQFQHCKRSWNVRFTLCTLRTVRRSRWGVITFRIAAPYKFNAIHVLQGFKVRREVISKCVTTHYWGQNIVKQLLSSTWRITIDEHWFFTCSHSQSTLSSQAIIMKLLYFFLLFIVTGNEIESVTIFEANH